MTATTINSTTTFETAKGVEYIRREFVDAWGRRRICDKRVSDLPQPHHTACECCGVPIAAERSTKRFCSDACKMREYRQRKRCAIAA